jgi:hypothetical protein
MDKLKLHSGGSKSHLKILKKELKKEIELTRNDPNLTEKQKRSKILKLKFDFEKLKSNILFNLY